MHVPKLTVLMPVYDGEAFLEEAIESVLAQDFTDYEFVIVDDGSRDRTPEILARYAARDPRVVLLRNDRNRGISFSLNHGLEAARGVYVARQDADDISLPGRFRRQVEVLNTRPDVVLVSTNFDVIDGRGMTLQRTSIDHPPYIVRWRMLFSNAIGGHGQVMFRTNVARELGGYDLSAHWAEDYDLWSRMLEKGELLVLPRVGMKHRHHDGRSSIRFREEQRRTSFNVTRRLLTAHLGRSISDDELAALSHLWRLDLQDGFGGRADRLVREAYRAFRRKASPLMRQRVRVLNARQFIVVAAFLLRQGRLGDAASHLARALSWHPLGLVAGSWYVANLATRYLWRRIVA